MHALIKDIKRIAVIGAGQMGAGATSVFAQEVDVTLLNIPPRSFAEQGLEKAIAAARSNTLRERVTIGLMDDDLAKGIGEADFVLETVMENMDIKRECLAKVDKYRRPGVIVGSCSSSLSIEKMGSGLSDDMRKHFLGIHLFNPPAVLTALEIVPSSVTLPAVTRFTADLMEKKFRRVIVNAKDRPGYAGNRIGLKVMNEALQLAPKYGVAMVDYLFSGYTGRIMPPLETTDLVGWDTYKAVMDVLYSGTNDEAHASLAAPAYMQQRIAQGALGNKTPDKGGFYKRVDNKKLVWDFDAATFVEPKPIKIPIVEQVRGLIHTGDYGMAMQTLFDSREPEAAIVQRWLLGYISYAGMRNGEVSDMQGINRVMAWGFNWLPPDGLADLVGPAKLVTKLKAEGLAVPPHIAAWKSGKLYKEVDDIGRHMVAR
ncbi:MAG: 3-hydroxyacyl-CoA dehydrogenase family protein [Dehalococcoidia bacterium]|nr:3-hydroxyacyl-CoA dehydrogenase family protein [Dehalococcoidia bacterium]